ncbi:MAG: hypothetical protein MJ119_07440 [Lachnospiraceae bacterium]|nr:hypothetical protein [Lachnospiraceae bacterium]
MDNYMDKLAEKFSAQEMIKANAQAEANEMQRLQEQVAQYEAILQDMRKLNYKNSELTDKINSLVDESISKMQQGAPRADGETSEVASNLSEAIMVAVDEALRDLDSNVGRALNESVNNTLMVPVDEMKQSSMEVSGSVVAVRQIAEDVKTSADEIRYASDLVKTSADDVTNSAIAVRESANEVRSSVDGVRESMDEVKSTLQGVAISTEDMKISSEEIKTTSLEIKNTSEDLKTSVKTSVDNALLAMRRENREIADHLEYIRSTVDTINTPSEEEKMKKQEEDERRRAEEQEREDARIAREEEDKRAIEEMFKQADDFVHKENIKVYRNVQAVVVDELKRQTDGLTQHNKELYDKVKGIKPMLIVAIVLTIVNIIATVINILGIF